MSNPSDTGYVSVNVSEGTGLPHTGQEMTMPLAILVAAIVCLLALGRRLRKQ